MSVPHGSCPRSSKVSRDEMIKLSCKSDVEMHYRYVHEDISSECTANTSLSAFQLTPICDDKSHMKLITEFHRIPHLLEHKQSLDLAFIKQVQGDQQVSGSQAHTSSVLEPGLATTGENTVCVQGIEDDIVWLSTSLEVLATTAGTLLTTSTNSSWGYSRSFQW